MEQGGQYDRDDEGPTKEETVDHTERVASLPRERGEERFRDLTENEIGNSVDFARIKTVQQG